MSSDRCKNCGDVLIEPEKEALAYLVNKLCQDCIRKTKPKNVDELLKRIEKCIKKTSK